MEQFKTGFNVSDEIIGRYLALERHKKLKIFVNLTDVTGLS